MIGRVLVGLWVDITTDRFLEHGMNLKVMAIIYATGLESLINNDIEAQEALMSLIKPGNIQKDSRLQCYLDWSRIDNIC
jgi:hypothetical protein